MKIIPRRAGESLHIIDEADQLGITIFKLHKNRVTIGIDAPQHFRICLSEAYNRIQTDLIQKIEAYYYNQTCGNEANYSAAKQGKSLTKAHILLVEDVDIIRKINSNVLQSFGYKVDTACDGREAFDLLQNKYDLILLDIGLPDISGIEICKKVRKCDTNLHTPIIFLTSYDSSCEEKCKLAGANDFATKPISAQKLQKLVKRWSPRKKQ